MVLCQEVAIHCPEPDDVAKGFGATDQEIAVYLVRPLGLEPRTNGLKVDRSGFAEVRRCS